MRALFISAITILLSSGLAACGGGGGGGSGDPPPAPTPVAPVTTAVPAGGVYGSAQIVRLTADKPATVYYTLNGNTPSIGAAGTLSAPSPVAVQVSSDTSLLQFFAVDAAGTRESIKSQTYVVAGGAASGPGDPQSYFPAAVGNSWTSRVSSVKTGSPTTSFVDTTAITATRLINGVNAFVFTESNPDNANVPEDEYFLVSTNGVIDLGDNDPSDTLTAAVVPYHSASASFGIGSSFVQANKSGFNYGQDLDGDGRNETADFNSVVSVQGVESVTVPAGTFANSLRIHSDLTLTLTLSGNGAKVTVNAVQNQWLAPRVGPVKSVVTTSGNGISETETDELTSAIIAAPFFTPRATLTAGAGLRSVTVGDFDNNGIADLAVANPSDVSVFLGTGSGAFGSATTYTTPGAPTSIAVSDLNADGRQDLAVANGNGDVSVLLGNGNGTFAAAANTTLAAGTNARAVVAADFNGDGKPDLAVAGTSFNAGFVWILLGNGDGTLGAPAAFATGGFADSIAAGDFNGDGKLDLAVVNSSSNVVVMLGNGTGAFGPAVAYTVGDRPVAVAVRDFNSDGKLDLAVATNGVVINNSSVSVLLGNGDGTFGVATPYVVDAIGGADIRSMALGDFNGDGNMDVAVANAYFSGPRANTVVMLLGNGSGGFGSVAYFVAPPSTPASVAVGDVNGDAQQDLAIAHINGVSVFVNAAP